ncbi:LamG domain-containing protein [Candidatus Marsarchaeota archaeon]|jgi:hypothetical protein|nr:LamG domain-containing protein [Candidatus Marsarchaeota archaeon]
MNKNMKGFIFTVDAIFSLIIATAAIAILLYSHFTPASSYSAPSIESQSVAQGLISTSAGSLLSEKAFNPSFLSPYLENGSGAEVAAFDGINSGISFGSTSLLNPASNVTLSAWVYVSNYSSNARDGAGIISKGSQYEISVNSIGYAVVDGVLAITPVYSNIKVPLDKWTHITGELSDNGTAEICVNTSCNSASGAAETSLSTSSDPLQIGNGTIPSSSIGSLYFDGYISNAQVYDRPLSYNQISTLVSEGLFGNPVNGSSLAGWWPLSGNPNPYNMSGSSSGYVGYVNTGILPFGTINASPSWSLLNTMTSAYVDGDGPEGSLIYSSSQNMSGSGLFINGTYASSIYSAYFTGSSNVNIPESRLISSPTFSVSLWFEQQSPSTYNYMNILSISGMYSAFLDSTNLLWSGFPGRSIGVVNPSIGTWYNLVAVDNGTYCWSYINGAESGGAWPCSPSSASASSLCIGCNNFIGYISNVQLYGSVLSSAQAASLYSEGMGAPPLMGAPLSGWWPLAGNAFDLSKNFDSGNESGVVFRASGYYPYSYSQSSEVSAITIPVSATSPGKQSEIYNSTVVEWK